MIDELKDNLSYTDSFQKKRRRRTGLGLERGSYLLIWKTSAEAGL